MDITVKFPVQTLSYKSKGTKWRKSVVDWAASRTYFNYSPIRKDVVHMKINYDLVNGILHMEDIAAILNPGNISTAFVPEKIQHYPIINSKIDTLVGEEAERAFDWRVIVTNPYSISKIEEAKKQELDDAIRGLVEDQNIDDEQAQEEMAELEEFFSRDWQDKREVAANELLRHYIKELGIKGIFTEGFRDVLINSIEVYHCGIVGGEPSIVKLNPMKLRVYRSGYSNKIEDADVIVYEDYWSPSKIIDTYYDELSVKDIKWLSDELPDYGGAGPVGAAGNYNEAFPFISRNHIVGDEGILVDKESGLGVVFDQLSTISGGIGTDLLPYDIAGNIRVIRVWWKSRRKILKVKSYDSETGDEVFDFYPETYVADEAAGEEVEVLWVNEAWEGTKIGENIYVGMRPCLVQHNSISNPSKCHFGIVGTIYNLNESVPYSLVDMMKPYNYLYDAIHAKLVDLIATNWGKILEMDLAMKPKGWEVDKWMYFARANKVLIKDSFKEGDKGASLGKIAGGLNNASKGYIDADWGSSIQNYIQLLEWTKNAMSELVGINRQREGQTYSRETVGGIERAVLQSSYITDWLFRRHEDTKRRVLNCYLDVCKASLKGRSKKFQYILSDGSIKTLTIDGDEFAESEYGLLVDSSSDTQKLNASIDSIAQAAMQNSYKASSLIKLYSSMSIQEKIRMLEKDEKDTQELQQQQQQIQQQMQQQQLQAQMQQAQMEMQQRDIINQRDNQTKIDVAEINSKAEYLRLGIYEHQNNEQLRREEMQIDADKLKAEIEQFDKELRFKEKELKQNKEIELKKIEASKIKQTKK